MDKIRHYFPELTAKQLEQFEALYDLYADWNQKINVISRKDFENLYERHILHSMGIIRFLNFKPGTSVMDVGTGGGFPGVPLAIYYPELDFYLIDSINKKLTVVQEVSSAIGLQNIQVRHCRVEEERKQVDFVVSRAVMPLSDLANLCKKNIKKEQINALPNGIICLKGGDLQSELSAFKNKAVEINLSDYFKEEYFKTKKVVYLPLI